MTILKTDVTPSEMALYEEETPTLMDLLPAGIKDAYSRVPEDIKSMEDGELIKAMNKYSESRQGPGSRLEDRRRDIRMKHALWYEYDRCVEDGKKMQIRSICKGIMPDRNFQKIYLDNKLRLEWILRPPLNYVNEQRVLLEKSIMGLHEILDAPVVRQVCRCLHSCICNRQRKLPQSKQQFHPCKCLEKCVCPPTIDTKLAQVKQRLHEMIELRVKGAIVQRVRVDKQHLVAQVKAARNDTLSFNEESVKTPIRTSGDIEAELHRLRGELQQLESGKVADKILDVTPEKK